VELARALDTRFRLVRHPDLRILTFDDESLVFNPRLWHTHFLNASAGLILECLGEAPASATELAGMLVDEAGRPALSAERIATAMTELADLSLIEPDDAPAAP
jgi:PqqD family protein of HPr-rel-A system